MNLAGVLEVGFLTSLILFLRLCFSFLFSKTLSFLSLRGHHRDEQDRSSRRRKPQGHCILAHYPPPPPLPHSLPWSTSYLTTQQDHPGFYNWVTLGPRIFFLWSFLNPQHPPNGWSRGMSQENPYLPFQGSLDLEHFWLVPASEFSCTLNHSHWRFLLYPENLFVRFWSPPSQEKLQIVFPFSLGV